MKKSILLFACIALVLAVLPTACSEETTDQKPDKTPDVPEVVECSFTPIEMPSQLANGHAFPTDSNTVQSWIDNSATVDGLETNPDMISHAWGLWKALTDETDQTCNGRKLRRFETWYTPQDEQKATYEGTGFPEKLGTIGYPHHRNKFEPENQGFHKTNLSTNGGDLTGKVKHNPATAQYVIENGLMDSTVMKSKIKDGVISKVTLPDNSVLLKPVYRICSNKYKVAPGLYRFNEWAGKQDGGKPDDQFSNFMFISTRPNDPRVDNVDTFSISDFIHFDISADEAIVYNRATKEGPQEGTDSASVGDIGIVLGMHVATRETTRWTWQTFFWSPTPDTPLYPSSKLMAAGRNTVQGLSSPANHYAVSLGYSMLSPAAPNNLEPDGITTVAGRNSVYALNPYIEGTFTADDPFFSQDSLYRTYNLEPLYMPGNTDGLTSSCMSCHSQAYYAGTHKGPATGIAVASFLPDQYVPRDAPWFVGTVQTDFAWSLSGVFETWYTDFYGVYAKEDQPKKE